MGKRIPVQIFLRGKKRLVESFKRLWMKLPKTIQVKRKKKKRERKKIVRRRLQRKMAKQSLSLRPNRSQNPKRKQLQQKRKRKMTLRRRKKPQKKRKIQMRNRLHPRPRKRGVDLQLKPPLKRNRHLKRNPNMKNASVHLNFQKVRQKATLATKKSSKVVTLNQTRGSTKPRNLPVEGVVGQQQKNGKGVDPIPQGTTTVVLLPTKKNSMKNRPHPLLRKREARKADPQQNPSMWTRILTKILTNPRKDLTLPLIKPKIKKLPLWLERKYVVIMKQAGTMAKLNISMSRWESTKSRLRMG